MTMRSQDYAHLADHSYDRQGNLARLVNQTVDIGGVQYRVLAHSDRPSGYQGTIYQRTDTNEIVVAHRGTEFEREKWKDLIVADGSMVASRSNPQADDAVALTRRAMQMAQEQRDNGVRVPPVTVTGHSLGGTLAQVSAHHFGLKGETFNAYGAASLDRRIPTGGNDVINHVMGADLVSSASPHYGQVRVYTNQREIDTLERHGYANNRNVIFDPRNDVGAAIGAMRGGSHDMHNFLPINGQGQPDVSILADPQARRLAEQYDPMIDKFRGDVLALRRVATLGLRSGTGLIEDAIDGVRGPLPPGEPARREQRQPQPAGQSQRSFSALDGVSPSPDMRNPTHPANEKFVQAYAGIVGLGRNPGGATERVAANITAEGAELKEFSRFALSRDGARVAVVDESTGPAESRLRADVGLAKAEQTSVETSTQQWETASLRLAATEKSAREQDTPAVRMSAQV